MTGGTVEFRASVDYDEGCAFAVAVSKGTSRSQVLLWGDADTWQDFGQQLTAFPGHAADYVLFEAGSFPARLILKAYCYNAQGHAALRVVIDNSEEEPGRCRLDFSIPAQVASRNRLGY